ncbi:hypothetical protein TrVFT333_007617 [Trichoderma virens FT-333]|nr:hypothetical protein TrVFT333_007617 [Trichoderma virens FT-333]
MSAVLIHPGKEFKQRRSHEKSRKGCIRCKKQRKKCDEARPTCSRCQKRNHCCQYTVPDERYASESIHPSPGQASESIHPSPGQASESIHLSPGQDDMIPEIPDLGYLDFAEASPSSSEAQSEDIRSGDSSIIRAVPYDPSVAPEGPQASFSLNSEELELLSHYITHTSRIIPFNAEELHALHVGIPNLAFGSRPVMGSILALSAVCKCYDIVRHSPAPLERIEDIKRLLFLADEHHRSSLGQIQAAIYGDHVDTVLANAALMSQWITSIRAAYVAYVGLQNSTSQDLIDDLSSPPAATSDDAVLHKTTLLGDDLYTPEDGPSEGTRNLLLPIVSATYRTALEKLNAQARIVWIDQCDSNFQAPKVVDSGLQACLTSLELLEELFNKVFASDQPSPEPSQSEFASSAFHLGKLERASPWLRKYLANVTSAIPSKLWRRTITAFLNHVPLEYLQLVQSALDHMPVAVNQADSTSTDKSALLGTTQQLAINIFAHWLVLVMLLDGVWWIGGIGQWELGRILSFTEAQGWITEYRGTGETWWPESMFAVQKAIAEPVE